MRTVIASLSLLLLAACSGPSSSAPPDDTIHFTPRPDDTTQTPPSGQTPPAGDTTQTPPSGESPAPSGAHIVAGTGACTTDADCVPDGCCHPATCTAGPRRPCNQMCTMECRGNTLDCGQGSCLCDHGTCAARITPMQGPPTGGPNS